MKKILMAVTGSVSAYKAVDVISALGKNGFYTEVIATEASLQFVSKNILRITAGKYWDNDWDNPSHIQATENTSIFAIIPATCNIIAKIAHGIADDLVSSSVLALPKNCVKIVCPACNSRMWENMVVQRNIKTIKEDGWKVLDPVSGMLACGTEGIGKLPPTRDIVSFIVNMEEKW